MWRYVHTYTYIWEELSKKYRHSNQQKKKKKNADLIINLCSCVNSKALKTQEDPRLRSLFHVYFPEDLADIHPALCLFRIVKSHINLSPPCHLGITPLTFSVLSPAWVYRCHSPIGTSRWKNIKALSGDVLVQDQTWGRLRAQSGVIAALNNHQIHLKIGRKSLKN